MQIAELYQSMQGEGRYCGTESIFVRCSGCNLRCWFCDTPYASWAPEGRDVAVDSIVAQVREWDTRHVVLTGGEPMLFSELIPLAAALRDDDRHITVETAGTLYLPVACDLMSISPKLANSTPSRTRDSAWSVRHEKTRHRPDVVHRLIAEYDYQLKFVIDTKRDGDDVAIYLEEFPEVDRSRVLLMPQGTDAESLERTSAWLEPYCARRGWTYCPRRQIEWYGLVRGT